MKGKREKVRKFFGLRGGFAERRSKSDLGLDQLRVNKDSPPIAWHQSRSRTSLNSSDDDEIKLLRQRPAIFVSTVGDRLNSLAVPTAIYGSPKSECSPTSPVSSMRSSETPSRSESPVQPLNLSSTSPGSRKSSRGNDSQPSPRTPNKEIVPKMNKSRNEKFHKLFKGVPDTEICLKGYSCAYMGDILLQGYLYISPNWFCFHSKILGIEKQIKIQVHKVLNITREKTAIFIPNAVGVVTAEDKYVFGSLMSRDNTYRIMFTVWKSLVEPESNVDKVQDVLQLPDDADGLDGNNLQGQDGTSIDDTESDSSICIHCGMPLHEHENAEPCEGDSAYEAVESIDAGQNGPPSSVNRSISQSSPPARHNSTSSTIASTPSSDHRSSTLSPSSQGPGSLARLIKSRTKLNKEWLTHRSRSRQPASNSPSKAIEDDKNLHLVLSLQRGPGHQKASVISATFQNAKKVPRTNLMLLVCMVMVMFLSISAVIMLHKILVLQAILDSGSTGHSAHIVSSDEDVYSSVYYLNHEYHVASIKRFHSVLEANINVLDQIHSSFKHLQVSISQHTPDSCEKETTKANTTNKETS